MLETQQLKKKLKTEKIFGSQNKFIGFPKFLK